MESVNKDLQDYFVKLAPDFSVFDMVERYYYGNNENFGNLSVLFDYSTPSANTYSSNFYRAMFLIYSDGNLSIDGVENDEYTVFPYYNGSQIVIAIQETPIIINSNSVIDLVIGVAF